jgi:N-acetylneuraminate synthase/N,N'-diacetyllegionaminate synthase
LNIAAIDLNEHVLLVAEIGNNHEGSFDLAQRLIAEAARAGADAVKFQTIVPERLVAPDQTARLEQLARFRLSYGQFERLARTAADEGVLFLSTPFDLESARFLATLVPAFKIASGDNDFFPLLRQVAETGKPILLSTGLADLSEVARAKAYVEDCWRRSGIRQEMALLHCVSCYPTPPESARLDRITALAGLCPTVGYSDHTTGIQAAVLATALGARIVEKHFTLDKRSSAFRDHQFSADPAEFAALVREVRLAQTLLGRTPQGNDCEAGTRQAARRAIRAARDLEPGRVLEIQDLDWLRPGQGLSPAATDEILGRRLLRRVARGEVILTSDLG